MKRWIVLGLIACACGSSNGGSNPGGTITGTVGGHPLDVKDAVFGIDPRTKLVWVFVDDHTGLCSLLGGATLPSTTTALLLVMVNITGPTSTGDYTTGNYSWADLAGSSALAAGLYWAGSFAVATSCTASNTTDAIAGTLTVTQVGNSTGTNLKATLNNLKFGNDTLNGSIEASYCAAALNPTCGGALLARPPGSSE